MAPYKITMKNNAPGAPVMLGAISGPDRAMATVGLQMIQRGAVCSKPNGPRVLITSPGWLTRHPRQAAHAEAARAANQMTTKAMRTYTVTWAPSSTTRPGGILKKSVGLAAFFIR